MAYGFNPSTKKQTQAELCEFVDQPGLPSEVRDSQSYTEKLCLCLEEKKRKVKKEGCDLFSRCLTIEYTSIHLGPVNTSHETCLQWSVETWAPSAARARYPRFITLPQ